MNGWFGEPWNGVLDDDGKPEESSRIPIPVGEPCGWCGDRMLATDSGQVIPTIGIGMKVELIPMHLECMLRSVVGGLDHLAGRCSCHPGGKADGLGGLADGMTAHEEALAVQEHVARHGI